VTRAPRLASLAILGAATLTGLAASTDRLGAPVERVIEPLRFRTLPRPASGRTVVVEMDAASIADIGRWPWPRRHHAAVIDRLHRAGAASIVFDVDFSAASTPADDAALAAALDRAQGKVALPTFAQDAATGDRRRVEALPPPALRDKAALASVSVQPDPDGMVRAMPLATITAGVPRPSLSAYIAARAGQADRAFPIDYAIDPASIPRLSFAAVEHGRFAPEAVRGRDVLIGATAIEIGDRYATGGHGVLPGVVIQALAAETLRRGVPVHGNPLTVLPFALLLAALALRARRGRMLAPGMLGAAAMLGASILAAQKLLLIQYPLFPGLALIGAAGALAGARLVAARFQAERATDQATGLPNHRAFLAEASDVSAIGPAIGPAIGAAQIGNLDALGAVLGLDGAAQAVLRMAERLRLVAADGQVWRVGTSSLAFGLAPEQADEAAMAALRTMLLQPVEVGGRRVDVALTVGTADAGSATERLAAATIAAGEAARAGIFWRPASTGRESLERSVSLMGELDAGIASGEVRVHYQPKLCLQSNRIRSAEALVRWQHPVRGPIRPDLFIPMAEEADRIEPLTLHVLATVLRDLGAWRSRGLEVAAAVNISAKLLLAPSFNAAVDRLLDGRPEVLDRLILEVTESAAMADPDGAAATLRRFRERGIGVSMDDYGTGQSTLSYLQRLPLNELKIDRSFVQFAHQREEDAVLVRSTVDLAHRLGLKVVAEGVEDAEGLRFLAEIGCDYAQGYVVARPMPEEAFVALLEREAGEQRAA
jgi:EAL domain-containing protein (putative c-di-GMP-specific phosphodiesterase class I)/CHASE2 domain-containing sensor protein